jgi:hypothetical protein
VGTGRVISEGVFSTSCCERFSHITVLYDDSPSRSLISPPVVVVNELFGVNCLELVLCVELRVR